MTMLSNFMLDIQHAYRTGKAGTGRSYSEDRPELLEQIQQWDYGIQPQEKVVKSLCFELLRTTIKMTREGELSNAEGLVQTMNGLIASSSLSRDSQYFCRSYIEAAAAYLDYKCRRYDRAMERLREAFAIDEQLELHNPDFNYMHLHRMMLLDNWVRVMVHQGHVLAAIELAFQVLDYLERKISSLPVPTTWDSSALTIYSADILSIFFRTMTSQIAEAITGKDWIEDVERTMHVRDVFAPAHHHLSSDSCHLSPASHDWIELKQAVLDDNRSVFLQHALPLLAAGPGPGRVPTLWYATIVEVILWSQRWPGSAALREELIQEIMTWQRLPLAWKTIIK